MKNKKHTAEAAKTPAIKHPIAAPATAPELTPAEDDREASVAAGLDVLLGEAPEDDADDNTEVVLDKGKTLATT